MGAFSFKFRSFMETVGANMTERDIKRIIREMMQSAGISNNVRAIELN